MSPAVELSGVTRAFDTARGTVHALGPVDLAVEPGSFVALLGPSGCGKSTLLALVAGLDRPTEGRVAVEGRAVTGPRPDVGMMFQDSPLCPWLSVRRNVALQLTLRGLHGPGTDGRIATLLARVGLQAFADQLPHTLSGGMQQRAALCQAIVHSPRVLLLDEPLGKLDALTRAAIRRDLTATWLAERQTVLLVTHSIDEAVELATRVCVIGPRPGRILADISLSGLPFPRDTAVRRSPDFADRVAELHDILAGAGIL